MHALNAWNAWKKIPAIFVLSVSAAVLGVACTSEVSAPTREAAPVATAETSEALDGVDAVDAVNAVDDDGAVTTLSYPHPDHDWGHGLRRPRFCENMCFQRYQFCLRDLRDGPRPGREDSDELHLTGCRSALDRCLVRCSHYR